MQLLHLFMVCLKDYHEVLPSCYRQPMVSYLSRLHPDEINFWQPGGSQAFSAIEPGAPFLFKLHSLQNFIAVVGLFVHHSFLPNQSRLRLLGQKNGTADFPTFKAKIIKYRPKTGKTEMDSGLGGLEPESGKEKVIIRIGNGWEYYAMYYGSRGLKNLFVNHRSRQGTSPTPLHP